MTMDLHKKKKKKKKKEKKQKTKQKKKIEKRKKPRPKNGLLKKVYFSQIKRQVSFTVLPILFEPRKEGWQCINILLGIPRLVN